MNTPKDKHPSKSSFCNASNDQEGVKKSINGSGSAPIQNAVFKLQRNDNKAICSDTSICSAELEDLPWQPSEHLRCSQSEALDALQRVGEYKQLSLLKSTPTLKQSCDRSSQEYQFTQISETTTQSQDLTLSPWVSPAQAHPTQELERDLTIQLPLFGEKDLEYWSKLNPASVLSNNEHPFVPQHKLWEHLRCSKELSNEDFELFLGDSLWQDTLGKLAMSRQQSLGQDTRDSDYLSFPTLTSNVSTTSRPTGQTKCEKWFKDNGLIPSGYQLGTQAIALTMGFPSNWFERLTQQYSKNQTTPNLAEPQEELEQDTSQDEQLHQDKQRSPSAESSTSTQLLRGDNNSPLSTENSSSPNQEISIPCLVKQPKQPEVKGIIKEDKGDRFLVDVDGEEISVSKLFVYPDLDNCSSKKCKTSAVAKQKVSDTSVKCSSNISPPSKDCSSKIRRHKGEGSGHIYYRTVTRNGKDYRQAYYQWRENGKQRTKYISKKLLSRVEEAEAQKFPVSEILVLLGGIDKCSSTDKLHNGKSSDTSNASIQEKVVDNSNECSSKVAPPSKKRRDKGRGTGYIECKPIKRSGKKYKQYWYHYEEWREGDRITKKSRYIPNRLVTRVQVMEAERTPVKTILEVLASKNKRSKK